MDIKYISQKDLEKKIYIFRTRMIDTGKAKGLGHPDTIKCSQELDVLIMKYQMIIIRKSD